MYQTILFKVPGRPNNRPVVIMKSMQLQDFNSSNHFPGLAQMLSPTLSQAYGWVKCNCTPVRILHFAFCRKVSMAVAFVLVCAMWWHLVSISDNIEACEQVAVDCLCALPWGIVWAIRASLMPMPEEEKGGEL